MNVSGTFRKLLNINRTCCRYLLESCSGNVNLTIVEAREVLRNIVGSSKVWGELRDQNAANIPLPQSQSELPARRMRDSYREAIVPIGRDKLLREKYMSFYNVLRIGRLMEDLDTMAVLIGYSHNIDLKKGENQKSPIVIVTALVDSLRIQMGGISHENDLFIRGHTTWVGTSSMEISLIVEQEKSGVLKNVLKARFLMVARDPSNKVKAFVNPLSIETPEEEALFDLGKACQKTRNLESQISLTKIPPSESERLIIHDLFLRTLDEKSATFGNFVKPENTVWMSETLLKDLIVCFPEERNLYNKVFGGFLMRKALELARANVFVYCKQFPVVEYIDDIVFKQPVEIGSLLYLSSQIVYTKKPNIQVKVHAEVLNAETGVRHTTNFFHLTFSSKADFPMIMPRSYAEYMLYLDGKRHYESQFR